ncbi:hypothetical protein [Aliiroseovarius sp. S253]|uniref:hypothetical protein n=1 Tax=Aliiroseovarius sp. S253 TaxID=3415133 RepID=UPI003C7B3AC5
MILFFTNALLILSAASASSIIIYIFAAMTGNVWVGDVLEVIVYASIAINLSLGALALLNDNELALQANAVFLLLLLLSLVLAKIASFPGIGDRHSNHGIGGIGYLALFNMIVVMAQFRAWAIKSAVVFVVVLPLTIAGIRNHVVEPLKSELRASDLQSACIIQAPRGDYRHTASKRILELDDLELGLFVGSKSPRILKHNDGEFLTWKFSKQKFTTSRPNETLGDFCH